MTPVLWAVLAVGGLLLLVVVLALAIAGAVKDAYRQGRAEADAARAPRAPARDEDDPGDVATALDGRPLGRRPPPA